MVTLLTATVVIIIMKMSIMIAAAALISTAALLGLFASVPTLCAPSQGVGIFLKLTPANANAVIYEDDGVPHATAIFDNGRIVMSPGILPERGRSVYYRGVEIRVDGENAWAEVNGIVIAGPEKLVKRAVDAALSGNNVYSELRRIGAVPTNRAVEVYVLNRNYCPFSNSPKVVVVLKDGNGYSVYSYFQGKVRESHVSDLKLAFCRSMQVKRVLYFDVNFSKWNFR